MKEEMVERTTMKGRENTYLGLVDVSILKVYLVKDGKKNMGRYQLYPK